MWPTEHILQLDEDSEVLTEEDAPITIATVPDGMKGDVEGADGSYKT